MDSAKQQLADKLKSASNVMVTVSRNPSVDQLASLLGLTLLLNKLDKHAAAVFSGEVPSTLEFLQPEETIEKNTDSLRDFIIALDKSKADKLRYKVEDNVVRIFITPYRTSISQDDLEFSQGDFNVDVVVALGVREQGDLDDAITMHGRILHDATVATINTAPDGDLGSINWHDPGSSSLSELVTELAETIGKDLIDSQIATALLTGIVAETNRFSNDKTTSQTMSASAVLMAAGANQQLVASKLEEPPRPPAQPEGRGDEPAEASKEEPKPDDGTLRIDHVEGEEDEADANDRLPEDDKPSKDLQLPEPQEEGGEEAHDDSSSGSARPLITQPPQLGGMLTANTQAEGLEPTSDPMSASSAEPPQLLSRPAGSQPAVQPLDSAVSDSSPEPSPPPALPAQDWTPPPPPPEWMAPPAPKPADASVSDAAAMPEPPVVPLPPAAQATNESDPTLSDLEASVHSPHVEQTPSTSLDTARDEVNKALSSIMNETPEPIHALNAQPLGADLHGDNATAEGSDAPSLEEQIPGLKTTPDEPGPPPAPAEAPATPQVTNPTAPPPVPPPITMPLNMPGNNPPQQ